MSLRSTGPRFLALLMIGLATPANAQESGRDATRSIVTVVGVDGTSRRVVFESNRRFDAPHWSPDGSSLVLNSGGKLWRVPAIGGSAPRASIPINSADWVDINHGISPDGKTLAFTAGEIQLVNADGGDPRRLNIPGYFHNFSPDGKTILYTANRGRGYEVFASGADGLNERAIATGKGTSDSPAYSPDGRWIYFNSNRSGTSDLWRVSGLGSGQAERVFGDGRENWAPRPSPDGRWLIFLSYQRKTAGHPSDRDVTIRRLPIPKDKDKFEASQTKDVVRIVGGHGSIGSRPWSPDGRQFAYVTYEPPPPTVRVVFFTPADIAVPAGAKARLSKVADSTEKFLFQGMTRAGYPPAVKSLFRREADGQVEVLTIKGDQPAASGKYARPNYAENVIQQATRQYGIAGDRNVWWIFIDVGDRPSRFGDWRGIGCSLEGGWAMVNYDTIPGEIRPDLGLQIGFNAEFALKGCIHELGHAFGLPHVGPDLALGLGNSLMGPNNSVLVERKLSKADQVYLTSASAARLWKHPVFSGVAGERTLQPSTVKLVDYKARYSRSEDLVTITGKLNADQPAHSVVVVDDRGNPADQYWVRGVAARLAPDCTFEVKFDKPARVDGHYRVVFCFDNGLVTGDGDGVSFDDPGEIRKSYRYREGKFQFGD